MSQASTNEAVAEHKVTTYLYMDWRVRKMGYGMGTGKGKQSLQVRWQLDGADRGKASPDIEQACILATDGRYNPTPEVRFQTTRLHTLESAGRTIRTVDGFGPQDGTAKVGYAEHTPGASQGARQGLSQGASCNGVSLELY